MEKTAKIISGGTRKTLAMLRDLAVAALWGWAAKRGFTIKSVITQEVWNSDL